MASMDFSFPGGGGAMIRTSGGGRARPVSTSGSGIGDIDTSFFEELARRRMEKEDAAERRANEEYAWQRRQRDKRESERRSDRARARTEREQGKLKKMRAENQQLWAQERVGTWGIPAWTPTLVARQKGQVNVSEGGLPGSELKSSVGEIEDAALERKRAQDQDFDERKRRSEYLEMTRERPRRW